MPVDIVIPNVGESVTTGVIATWLKSDGEWVDRDETVLELETDKVTMEVPAPAAGLVSHSANEGDEVEVGSVVGLIDDAATPPARPTAQTDTTTVESSTAEPAAAIAVADSAGPAEPSPKATTAPPVSNESRATPLAAKVATQLGVDLANVVGTGAGNRIREQDVRTFAQSGPGDIEAAESAPDPVATRGVTRERMSPLRRRIAQRLVEAQQTAAMLTTFNECDMTHVMALRKKHKEAFAEKFGVGLGFMSFFIKAAAAALRAFPRVNAYIVDDEGSPAVESHDFYDIAVAVSTPKGLVVPVIRNVERLSFAEIELAIKDLAARARDGKLSLDEMTGGTFTITNGGVFGSLLSTPILNPPQSAILGMHTIKKRAVEDPDTPGQIVLRPMMYLAVSYDHRIVDGAEAVQFLVAVKEAIEDPTRLMLEL